MERPLTPQQAALLENARIEQEAIPSSVRHGIDMLGLTRGMRVLDLGCGPGVHLGLFAEMVESAGQVAGVDIDKDCVAVARTLWAEGIAQGRFVVHQADVMQLPFDDGSFDCIWSSAVFHHLPEPVTALRELCRVVRSGGQVALLDGDLGCSFPTLPWSPDMEDRLRAASWRAASEGYGGSLPYHYDPFFGRHMLELVHDAGFVSTSIHALAEVVHAPLSLDQLRTLGEWFDGWFNGRLRPYLSARDYAALTELFDIELPGNLLESPGFFMNRTWLLVIGQRPMPSNSSRIG